MSDKPLDENSLGSAVYKNTNALMAEGYEAFAVAAVYIMVALQIYRSTMSEEDYNTMVDTISESRDRVKKLLDLDKNTIIGKSDTVH